MAKWAGSKLDNSVAYTSHTSLTNKIAKTLVSAKIRMQKTKVALG